MTDEELPEIPNYDSPEFQYGIRLFERTIQVAHESTPPVLDLATDEAFWNELELADQVLRRALIAYSHGKIEKTELDTKAAGYLHHWRALVRERAGTGSGKMRGSSS